MFGADDFTEATGTSLSEEEALRVAREAMAESPKEEGSVVLLCRRPAELKREVIAEAQVTREHGVEGDTWRTRPNRKAADGAPDPRKQIAIMNSRVALAFLRGGTSLGDRQELISIGGD
jgi:hypothetical protein